MRHKVMWPEKELEYVKLQDDHTGIHYGLFVCNDLVSVISIFEKNREVQFRKFATAREMQGRGYGSILFNYVLEQVGIMGVKRIWCNARKNKVNFYKRFGLKEIQTAGIKDGMEYVIMSKDF